MFGQQSGDAGATRLTFGQPAWPQTGGDPELADQLRMLIGSCGEAGMLLVDLRRVMHRRLVDAARLDRALGVLRADPSVIETRELRTSAGRPREEQVVLRLRPEGGSGDAAEDRGEPDGAASPDPGVLA